VRSFFVAAVFCHSPPDHFHNPPNPILAPLPAEFVNMRQLHARRMTKPAFLADHHPSNNESTGACQSHKRLAGR